MAADGDQGGLTRTASALHRFSTAFSATLRPAQPDGSPEALEAELAKLSKRQLRQRATEAGVSSSALKEAQAGPTPKASAIELILTASQAVPMEQPMANAP